MLGNQVPSYLILVNIRQDQVPLHFVIGEQQAVTIVHSLGLFEPQFQFLGGKTEMMFLSLIQFGCLNSTQGLAQVQTQDAQALVTE